MRLDVQGIKQVLQQDGEKTIWIEKQHESGLARVIPIILRSVDWKDAPFSHLQALPTNAQPVTGRGWRNRDEAFTHIAQGIRSVVEEYLASGNQGEVYLVA